MKKIFILLLISSPTFAQQLAPLTIEKIMRNPKWMGVAPSNVFWAENSKQVYFNWNPENNSGDSLYTVVLPNLKPVKISPQNRRQLPAQFGNHEASGESLN